MRLLNWLNRYLGKSEPSRNLQFDSFREDSNAKLELTRLEDRIVLSVSAALVAGDVLELNLDAANDEATVSVIDGGNTLQVEQISLPGSILQFDASQISSILVTGIDASQIINFQGQEDLVLPGGMDAAGFTGSINIGTEILVDPGESLQFNPAAMVTYLGQFEVTGDHLDVILPNQLNADDAFIIQINGSDLEILNPNLTTPLLFSTSAAPLNSISVQGADGETDLLTLDYSTPGLSDIAISFDGGVGGNDALAFSGGVFDTVTHDLTGPGTGSIDFSGNGITEISYAGLEPVTSTTTAANVILSYSDVSETITISDAGSDQTIVTSTAGETYIFTNPTNSLIINTGAGDDIIELNSLTPIFTASLTINGDADNDTINTNSNFLFATGKTIEFNAETINVANGITLTATAIAFNATEVNLDGDLISAAVSGDTTTVNVLGAAGGADIQDAVDIAGNGGIINVAAGIYNTTGTLNINESVSLSGAGKDVVQIRKAGAPTNNYDVAVNITANDVTISGAQLGWETHTSTPDYQGYVVYTTADNTTLNNLLFSDNYRSAVVFEDADHLEISDSIFEGKLGRAAIRDGDYGSGEDFLITRNEFREDHFRWGPIAIGPQGTFGDPNNFAFSGEISYNYFGNGLEAGLFQEAGDQNYTVTITNGGMTDDGIDIVHNTFDWQDSATTNANGIYAQPGGIYFDPSLAVALNTVNITDNIFNGFTYDGPQPTTDPLWNPAGGFFGGALEFDGVDDFGVFQDPSFDVGQSGTLSFWVLMDDTGRRNQFFEGPDNSGLEFQYRTNGSGQFYGRVQNNGEFAIEDGGSNAFAGLWTNIQYTWDAATSQMHIYINGNEQDYLGGYDENLSGFDSTHFTDTINGLMSVGYDPGSSGRNFDGLMDDVGWFNAALNQAELDAIRINGVENLAADIRLVAHWDFDQASGDIAIDKKNSIQMFLSTDGIVPFGPEFQTTAGQFGGALEFDGIDDFATFQDASFDVGQTGTLNFWVKMDDTGHRNQFFEGPDNGGFEFQFRTNGGGQFFGRTQDGGDYTIQQGPLGAGVEGVWTNIQYTWDAGTGEMHIYLNGSEEPYLSSLDENLSGFDNTHFTDTINGLMNVGRDPGDPSRSFDGLMDDIGWFNDVLTPGERAGIMTNGVSDLTGDSRLVAHWNLDDAPGTTVVSGNSGTNIDLYIQAEPPLPPIQGFGVIAPLNANVTFNAFNDNDLDSNVTLDSTNVTGDPLFAYESDPLYIGTDSLEVQFTIGFGSSAAYTSSEFASDTNTMDPHIGAYQNPPTLFPGIYGTGDIVVYGTGEDDFLDLVFTDATTATFTLTRDVGGAGEITLDPVVLTGITSITFNSLEGDDNFRITNPAGGLSDPIDGITFNGGTGGENGSGDTLEIIGGMATTVKHVFVDDATGSIFYDSEVMATISYTGLEPIIDTIDATNRIFSFTGAAEAITLSNSVTAGETLIDSTLGESVSFLNPTGTLTIHTEEDGGSGIDSVTVNGLDPAFNASLAIQAGGDDAVTFQSAIDLVSGDLLVTAETVDILANINAASVDISSSGVSSTTFNGGTVTTTGSQLYQNAVNFDTSSTLTSSGGGAIEFSSTVDGGIHLIIDTTGNTIIGGTVGSDTVLTSLTTTAGGETHINGGSITTTGDQIFNDDVILGVNTILASTGSGAITFNETLNGTYTLNLNTGGATTFNGTVGDANELTSLTTDAGGMTNINGGSIDTTGDQIFLDVVNLGDDTFLTSTGSGAITFDQTLDGTYTLNLNTNGPTTFNGAVGNTDKLTSLNTDASGATAINGGTVNTSGAQTYNDAVTLGMSTTFSSSAMGNITFNSSAMGGTGIQVDLNSTNDIILNGAFTTDGNVTATADSDNSAMGDFTMLAGASLDAGSGTIDIDGANVFTRSLTTTNTSATSILIDANHGNVTTRDTGVNSLGDIAINATGSITLENNGINTGEGGNVVIQAQGDIISTGTGINTTLGMSAGGTIKVTSDSGSIDFSNGSLLTGDGGNIGINAATEFTTISSSFDTTAGTGNGSVDVNVSAGSISITGGGITVNDAGTIQLTAKGTTSDILISSDLTSADGSITILADNDITLTATANILSQASGSITLTADNDGSSAGRITMDSGSTVESQGGLVQLSAYDSVAVSSITTTGGRVEITSTNDSISDNDGTSAKNVTANQLVINANTGVGQFADAIDTAISFLEADAGMGGLFLDNMGDLTIGDITAQVGADADADIVVNVMGTLDIIENVQSAMGSVTFDATDTLTVDDSTTIATLGMGALLLTSSRNIKLNNDSNLKTVDGGITLLANDNGITAGDFIGIEADKATIETAGEGNISLTGFGGTDAPTSNHYGVYLHNGTSVISANTGAAAGTIRINGTGGTGIDENTGVLIDGTSTSVTSIDGNILIESNASSGIAFQLSDQATVSSMGTGVNAATITINGTTTSDNAGVAITSNVKSTDGNIAITGMSTGGGTASEGVLIQTASGQINSTNGDISIDGTSNGDEGIEISAGSSVAVTGIGNIELIGESTGTGSGIEFDATIKSDTGNVTLTAEDDVVLGSAALIDSTSGTVAVTADNAVDNNSDPITMADGALIDAGAGDISLTTDGTISLGGLLTTGTVTVTSEFATIVDNGDLHPDIIASTAVLNAATGIGDGNPLETEISTLSATISGIGNLFIDNTNAVTLLDVSTFDGNITVNATGEITATSVVSMNNSSSESNDISLTATGINSDILVTTITANGNADVTLTAEDDILDTDDLDNKRITADNLMLTSNSADGSLDGIDVDTAVNSVTAAVNTNAGGIRIDEVDSIILTQVTTADGFITVNAGGTIQALNVLSANSSLSDMDHGITLKATGTESDISVTTITAQNNADITLNAGRDILDPDSSDLNMITGDQLTAVAGGNIGGITSIFTETGFDPLQTSVDHLDLTSGAIIAIHNTGTTPELINLDAGTGIAGTTFIKATGGALDASTTGVDISNTQDTIGLVSDVSITVPDGLQTSNLRLDAPEIINAGVGNIDINAVNAILFQSTSDQTVEITAQEFDGTATGSIFTITNTSPALNLVDLNADSMALTGGIDTDVSLSSTGSITVTDLVQTLGTGTLFLQTTSPGADLSLNENIQSETGTVTISTADDIIFNGSSSLINTSGSVMLTAADDIVFNDSTSLVSTTGSVLLTADNNASGVGGITMANGAFIDAGDGTVTLDATDAITLGHIVTTNATGSAIQLSTDSSIIDAGDDTGEDLVANESGARVTIMAALGAGNAADSSGAIETNIDQVNITNLTTGDIQIVETDTIIVHNISQSMGGYISVTSGDNISLAGLIQAEAGDVLLDSQAAIIDQNDGMTDNLNILAKSLDVNAVTGIDLGDTLEISVETLSADTINGDLLFHNTAITSVTVTSMKTDTGEIALSQIGDQSLTIAQAITLDGTITISNVGDAQTDLLTLTSLSAGGAMSEINVSTIDFGNILLGDLSALNGSISVVSAGEINDADSDAMTPGIDLNAASGSITLEATNGIGNTERVELAGGTLSINTTTGNLDLANTSSTETGSVGVSKLTTNSGTIDFLQTGGQDTAFEEIATKNSAITIQTNGAMEFENFDTLTNVVSTDGTGTIQVTATGVNSSIQINDGFSTDGGTIDLTAQNSLSFGSDGDVNSANGKITLLADSASLGSGGGGISMSDGTIFDAGSGIVDLQAGDDISIGQLSTTTLTRLTSTAGGVVDAGDTGGRDITAAELVFRTADGAGSANSIETAVSLIAARNTDTGSIQVNNDLGGALLTIGSVDGLAGVTNAAGVAGDIVITNASPLTVDAPVTNSSGGNIALESTGPGDLTLNASVRAFGGDGDINVNAGDGILDINDTGAASDHSVAGSGTFSGFGNGGVLIDGSTTLNSETGAIAGVPPDLRNIFTPQILATGEGTITGDFGRFSEQNFFITVDWGDGTVETFNFSDPGSFVFSHTYIGNPNIANPAADIPILVTMQGDMQFTFTDGGGSLDFTSQTGLLATPGEGFANVAIDTTPQVPHLIFPRTEVILDSTSNQQAVFTSKDSQSIESAINEANKNAERLVFLRILAPNGTVIEDVPLPESDLDNLPQLFKSLPDGRYHIYLKEAGEERIRLLMDVDIRGGKATDVTEDQMNQSSPEDNQDSPGEDSSTQLETESPFSSSANDNLFQKALQNLTTVITAKTDGSATPNHFGVSEQFLIDNRSGLQSSDSAIRLDRDTDQNNLETNTNQATTDLDSKQANTAEKAWSSAALLSGYFHGKSLLKKPIKQEEFDGAMEKYGNRLLNRHYHIFKRNP